MKELPQLLARFDPDVEDLLGSEDFPFSLENGANQLRVFFSDVQIQRYHDELRVTDVDVLADYIFSSMHRDFVQSRQDDFINFLKQEMAANDGVIIIKKDSGLFLAR